MHSDLLRIRATVIRCLDGIFILLENLTRLIFGWNLAFGTTGNFLPIKTTRNYVFGDSNQSNSTFLLLFRFILFKI